MTMSAIHPMLLFSVGIPAGCFLVAAWPLLFAPRLRPALAGTGGSGCIGLAAALIGLLAGGFVQVPGVGAHALADDQSQGASSASQLAEAPAEEEKDAKTSGDLVIEQAQEKIEIPPGRPKWIGVEPNFRGKTHTIPVSSGPYATEPQSKRALEEAIVKATNDYIAEQLGSDLAPKLLHYSARTIQERFVKRENTYHDTPKYSVGFMHEDFALLEFGPDFRNELDRHWTKVRATSRLAQTGLISGAALLLLGSIFSYFRLDNATRGYYTGRLQFMTGAAILAVVGAGAVLAQWIHWL
jgi:hypothetical protein